MASEASTNAHTHTHTHTHTLSNTHKRLLSFSLSLTHYTHTLHTHTTNTHTHTHTHTHITNTHYKQTHTNTHAAEGWYVPIPLFSLLYFSSPLPSVRASATLSLRLKGDCIRAEERYTANRPPSVYPTSSWAAVS